MPPDETPRIHDGWFDDDTSDRRRRRKRPRRKDGKTDEERTE
jgi:hypothetical protein